MWWGIVLVIICVLLLLCFLLAVANFSGERFMEKYEEVNKQYPNNNLTPLAFISHLNKLYFNNKLQVVQISEVAKDCYAKGKLFLSTQTLRNPSYASFTIIAHEIGHAFQDKTGKKLKKLNRLRKIGRLVGTLLTPSIIAGVVLMILGHNLFYWGVAVASFGVFIFILALIIKLRTISIEKDASKNAIKFLKEFFDENDLKKCKSFLNDARLTYWADFLKICLGWTTMSRKTKLFN
ncbi:MAG: zinc metallopeptidase [Clostridia bacterium]|nr:zinc metallopeptidase [Clostridia bacterium]